MAKLFRNFYPSMIDSLHSWSLLAESGTFDRCFIDAVDDAYGKTDLTVFWGISSVKIALSAPGSKSSQYAKYKRVNRSNGKGLDAVQIQLTWDRPKEPGNKRWYNIDDFEPVFDYVAMMKLLQSHWNNVVYKVSLLDSDVGEAASHCVPVSFLESGIILGVDDDDWYRRIVKSVKIMSVINTVTKEFVTHEDDVSIRYESLGVAA